MKQFQGSLGPLHYVESEHTPATQNPHLRDWTDNNRATPHNLGKVTKFAPHDYRDDCVCRSCRKTRALERRSWEPLTRSESVRVYTLLWAGAGITVLFLVAAWVS